MRRGKEARLCFLAHVLMDNREGLVVNGAPHPSRRDIGTGRRTGDAGALPGRGRVTVGTDRGYDTRRFVKECQKLKVTRCHS